MQLSYKTVVQAAPDQSVCLFRLTNRSGAYVELSNFGARWISAYVPDHVGQLSNVILGYDRIEQYFSDPYYMGAVIGRFANRISGASFTIDGRKYRLEANDGVNSNHGGLSGFHHKLWSWSRLDDGIRFSLYSPDGEGGYPGNVHVCAEYRWTDQNELWICFTGETDKSTYLNMTNHAYFNLFGKEEPINAHRLYIPAGNILETTRDFIPTGRSIAVENTPFDFLTERPIGRDLNADNEQLRWNRGYNHCYVLNGGNTHDLKVAAVLSDPESGRRLTVKTDSPGLLLYTAGYYCKPGTAVCLETQYFPDTPSRPEFPSCLLKPGEEYEQKTVYRFDSV